VKSSRVSSAFCCFLVFYFSVFALGSDRVISQYVHTAWGEKEGAPSGVLAMAQTEDGYLWTGGVGGLYRFDGIRFERMDSETVYALMAVPNGDLWIGLAGKIEVLRNGKITRYAAREGVPSGKVAGFAEDRESTIWVSTNAGLARLEGDRWEQVGEDWNFPGTIARAIFADRHGTLWVATGDTLVRLTAKARRFQTTGISIGQVWKLAEAANGRLWMAETTRSVRPVPRGDRQQSPDETSDGTLDETEIRVGSIAILFDQEGALWITTIGDGVRRMRYPEALGGQKIGEFSDSIESFTSKDGLSDDTVTAILEDREGNVWVGTNNGIDRFSKSKLARIILPEVLHSPVLAAGDAGTVLINNKGKLFEVQGAGVFTVKGTPGGVFSAHRGPSGGVWWVGTGYVYRQNDGRRYRLPGTASHDREAYVADDNHGVLWADVAGEGLFYLKDDTWMQLDTFSLGMTAELAKLHPSTSFTDGMGRVWFGYVEGTVIAIRDGAIEAQFSSDKSPTRGPVIVISGRGGHVWVGGTGLILFDGSDFRPMIPDDAAYFKVRGLEETADGSLWLCEDRGVVHVPAEEVRQFLGNPSHRVKYELFDSADGLTGSFRDSTTRSKEIQGTDGRLWFVATKGIVSLDPKKIFRNLLPPPVSIQSVEAEGREYASQYASQNALQYESQASLILPPRLRNLHISYTALSLSIPERVRFRYKLEGVDKDWEDVGTRREAFYTNLGPGKHRFRVIACNNDGVWNETGATLDFSIAPAWFQTKSFRGLCVLGGALLIWALYRLRVAQIHKSLSARFDERLAERTRMARELHDTFLQTIQGSKLVADNALKKSDDPERMRGAVEQLSVWLGQATEEGRAVLNSLRTSTTQKNDLAEAFKRATEESRLLCPLEVSFSITGESKEMHPVVRDEIYRVGYEAIRNACAHSKGSRLEVRLKYGRDLVLQVKDNGVGIDPTVVDKGKEGHFGLQGMRERVARIGGKLTVARSPDSGTEITIVVPGGIVFREPSASPLDKIRTILRKVV
jgi:signal transduction histidine kinase/ligand-binding sensor domain-containing protein